MATLGRVGSLPAEQRRVPQKVDFLLLLAGCLLLFVGMMTLFSKSEVFFKKQLIYGIIGLVPFSIFAFTNPKVWMRTVNVLYVVNLLGLMAVLVKGKSINGATRWIDLPGGMQFQPSELAKLLTVITLATFFAVRQESIDKPSTFFLSLAHVGVPVFLIYKQPHLGTTLLLLTVWFAIAMTANVPSRFLWRTVATLAVLVGLVLFVPPIHDKLLKGYQGDRIMGMGKNDAMGKNYQTYQAEIAFGVGSVFGTGYGKGEQKAGGHVPIQENDFIFTVIGEEGGLVGCTLVLGLFAFFFYRVWLVMFQATEPFHRMIAAGLLTVMAFHTVVNLAMVLAMLPVVGLWLPFISYGGTALWLCMASFGLLLQVRSREKPILF